jgi:hypothetical protein
MVSGASMACRARTFVRCHALIALSGTLVLAGCLWGRGSLDGKVIDMGNGAAPVAGAILVLTRSRPIAGIGPASCEGQQLTYSDAQGRFHFDRWSPPGHSFSDVISPIGYLMNLTVYKRGLGAIEIGINDEYRGVVKLESQNATREALLIQIRGAGLSIRCNDRYLDSAKPLMDALKSEAAELATTPKELNEAVGFLNPIGFPAHITPREPAQTIIQSPPTPSQSGAPPQ